MKFIVFLLLAQLPAERPADDMLAQPKQVKAEKVAPPKECTHRWRISRDESTRTCVHCGVAESMRSEPPPGLLPRPTAKSCRCSPQCTCGCNDGQECRCNRSQSYIEYAPYNAPAQSWYSPPAFQPRMMSGRGAANC